MLKVEFDSLRIKKANDYKINIAFLKQGLYDTIINEISDYLSKSELMNYDINRTDITTALCEVIDNVRLSMSINSGK